MTFLARFGADSMGSLYHIPAAASKSEESGAAMATPAYLISWMRTSEEPVVSFRAR